MKAAEMAAFFISKESHMAINKWSGVAVAIQSALGAEQTIDSISKASPGVVTYQGTDPTNGVYVKLVVQGMHQLDGRVFRVANVNAGSNTLELEGENTTDYDTFVSGTLQVITFGTTMSTARGVTSSGGDFNFIDTSTIHDNIQKQIPGQANALSFTFENLWDPSDAAQTALKAASDVQGERAIRITFATGNKIVFNGFVGATLSPGGTAQDVVTTSIVITAKGRLTVYQT
jgi:hypothetical protein